MSLEHEIEVPRLRECSLVTADRACCVEINLISSESRMAGLAVNHRIGEVRDMA